MGQAIFAGLSEQSDLRVVALVDPHEPARCDDAAWYRSIDELDATTTDVLIDFSTPAVTLATVEWALNNQVAMVIGTTGLDSDAVATMDSEFTTRGGHGIMASNFSIGAVLAEKFAAMAAPYFDRVEIIELHHDKKVDAPSGTSLATARKIAAARRSAGIKQLDEPTQRETVPHARGAEVDEGIRVHAVRLPGLVAHQEVLFGRAGEGLTIRHDSFDRVSFVGGVALAVRHAGAQEGLTIGLDGLV